MDNKITIGFYLKDDGGNEYEQKSTLEVFYDLGENDLEVIGRQFNSFLKQCTYVRQNENIFMADITDEEYDALADYLSDLREEK